MIDKIFFWLIVKAFYFLKKKYPDGKIKNIELIEIDKLTGELKEQFNKLDVFTSEEADEELINSINSKINNLLTDLKNKITKGKK